MKTSAKLWPFVIPQQQPPVVQLTTAVDIDNIHILPDVDVSSTMTVAPPRRLPPKPPASKPKQYPASQSLQSQVEARFLQHQPPPPPLQIATKKQPRRPPLDAQLSVRKMAIYSFIFGGFLVPFCSLPAVALAFCATSRFQRRISIMLSLLTMSLVWCLAACYTYYTITFVTLPAYDEALARVRLFAVETIPAYVEATWHDLTGNLTAVVDEKTTMFLRSWNNNQRRNSSKIQP